jgi:regulator of nonsense transcripts 1
VQSRVAQRGRFDFSLLQRLVKLGARPQLLTTQYRMQAGLSAFPSRFFYGGLLRNGTEQKEVLPWFPHGLPGGQQGGQALFWWDVRGEEELAEDGQSYVNRHELGAVAVLLGAFVNSGVNLAEVGVITPYGGQQASLIENLPRLCEAKVVAELEDLEVASVDAFQGREKDYVILSSVRANDQFDIGFLKDARRLCVSLTRAKYGLAIVGCAKTLSRNSMWRSLLEHCEALGGLVEGSVGRWQAATVPRAETGAPSEAGTEVSI